MKPGALLLLVGSVALWTGLLAAPTPRTSGQPPLPPSGAPVEAPQDKISREEEANLPCGGSKEPQVAQKSPLPQGKDRGAHGEMGAEEPLPGKEGSLSPEEAGPAPPGKLLCREDPPLEGPPVNNLGVESSGASKEGCYLDSPAQLGGGPVSRDKPLPGGKEKPASLGRPRLASKPAWPNLESWNPVWDPRNVATSGGKPNTSEKPVSSTLGDKPTPGTGKPTPTERPVPGSGHPTQDKPKPASAAGHPVVVPTPGEKPVPNSSPEAHGRPVAGKEPSSQVGHEKRPSADKPTSSGKPEHGEEPQAKKESKPEKEAEEGKKTEEEAVEEEEEEEGRFDDTDEEEEDEEGEKGKESEEGTPEGKQEGDDAFDKELDYGLNRPPFDAYSYHDAWSDEGAQEADLSLMGETAAPPQAADANSDGEPTFDAWGDLVGGSRP